MPKNKSAQPVVNKTEEVNEYMNKLEHPLKAETQAVREIIMSIHPQITEQVKWNAPSFSYKGYMVTFNLHDIKHLRLIFHNGAILNNQSGLLTGEYPDRRIVYFSDLQDVQAKKAALENIIQEWIRIMDGKI